jgi:hypothetical protein
MTAGCTTVRHGQSLGADVRTDVFATKEAWEEYAIGQLKMVERLARELGIIDRLHLWPDKSFGTKASLARVGGGEEHEAWLKGWWSRVSEWPTGPA